MSHPVGTPLLRREKGKPVDRAGPGRDDWEGAGGSVGQDPGRVLLRFHHGWGESQGEKETAQDCVWRGGGTQEQEGCRTLWEVPGGSRAHGSTSQMQRSADHFSGTQIFWTHTFHVASLEESRAGGGVEIYVQGLYGYKKLEQQRWDLRSETAGKEGQKENVRK